MPEPQTIDPPGSPEGAPLHGIRVLDLTSVVVGPTATLVLAEQGAEVIKVEAPGGDLMRSLGGRGAEPGMSPKFLHFNKGKRSIVLDLKQPAARAALLRIAAGCDVLISNIRPAALARLGLDGATLAAANPRLVRCAIVGFGQDGPYRDLPAYDTVVQGACGMAACMGEVLPEPRYMPFVITDHIVGFIAAQAICAALLARERTGRGGAIEVPMFENMAAFVLAEHMGPRTLAPGGDMGDRRVMNPEGKPIRTADGFVCVSPNTDAQAHAFFDVIGRPELKHDPRFATVAARLRNVAEYFALRRDALAAGTTAHWVAALQAAGVPCMRFNALEELMDDPHLRAVGLTERHGGATVLRPANRFDGHALPPEPAPRLGQDGADILREFGFSPEEAATLLPGAPAP